VKYTVEEEDAARKKAIEEENAARKKAKEEVEERKAQELVRKKKNEKLRLSQEKFSARKKQDEGKRKETEIEKKLRLSQEKFSARKRQEEIAHRDAEAVARIKLVRQTEQNIALEELALLNPGISQLLSNPGIGLWLEESETNVDVLKCIGKEIGSLTPTTTTVATLAIQIARETIEEEDAKAPNSLQEAGSQLTKAAKKSDLGTMSRLIDVWPDCIDWQNNYGCTALHYACMGNRVEVAKMLVQRGAELNLRNKGIPGHPNHSSPKTPMEMCDAALRKQLALLKDDRTRWKEECQKKKQEASEALKAENMKDGGQREMPEKKVLMLGLDGAGKTTLLYKLKFGGIITTIPTVGFNVESIECGQNKMNVWDVGGQDKIRPAWRRYYPNTHGLIFVVDSNSTDRLDEARDELHKILSEDELRNAVVLVFANKQDLPNALSALEMTKKLGLHQLCSHQPFVQATSATDDNGLKEGMDWLSSALFETPPEVPCPGYR